MGMMHGRLLPSEGGSLKKTVWPIKYNMAQFHVLATNSKTNDWWIASAEDSEMDQTINLIPDERKIDEPEIDELGIDEPEIDELVRKIDQHETPWPGGWSEFGNCQNVMCNNV